MALKYKRRRTRNTPGAFFVDESCVDCDICRWMDPRTFKRSGLGTVVVSQPQTEEDRLTTFRAMLACPTGSIRTMQPDKLVVDAMASYPLPIDEERLPGIYQLAPTTRESMGNTPYLIVRPEGNIMIDVPRFLRRTAERVRRLGGVKYLIVTSKSNAYGHRRWKKEFPGMIRILHRIDLITETRVMEERLDGPGPWHLVKNGRESTQAGYATGSTARFDFNPNPKKRRAPKDKAVKIIGVPGHTNGAVAVVYTVRRDDGSEERVAFSGGAVGYISYLEEGITWLLPGFGARVSYASAQEATADLESAASKAMEKPTFSGHPLLDIKPLR